MLFYDYPFIFIFLPVALLVYYLLPRGLRNGWLFLSSCIFYSTFSLNFLLVLISAAVLTQGLGLILHRSRGQVPRKIWLSLALSLNLGALVWFKYYEMFAGNLRHWSVFSGLPFFKFALPLGISYYTFKNISYLIDLYRGQTRPAQSLIDYAAYLTLFPQLIAGPIMRFQEIAGQMRKRPETLGRFADGFKLFLIGMSKKILLADSAAYFANPLFELAVPGFWRAWASVFLYSAQIYFDFSGYSDMAIGLGMMFGFEFPQNFNSPYQAASFSEFWRRWHMTLSRWLRDYLYIPLGGNRKGKARTYLNLMLTMLLGGLWHGASWNFMVWGGWHGALLAIERYLGIQPPEKGIGRKLRIVFNFILISIGWVFFRCKSFTQSLLWLKSMFLLEGLGPFFSLKVGAVLAVLLPIIFGFRNSWELRSNYRYYWIIFIIGCFLLSLAVAYTKGAAPFVYARF